MAYATIDDMIARFGSVELVRISTPADREMDGVVASVVTAALDDASALIDSYVRRRYQTPIDVAPREIIAACCNIARFNLATGDGKTASDEVRQRQKDAVAWLVDIAKGTVRLELDQVAPTTDEVAEAYIGRCAVFG
ncbi:MAG TPA: DUF1320 domain-containing protein [Gammaproteobacteria bacterium]|nr:DUF1320 domain-containing protein [Gammaproteobacteria bacterium]